MSKFFVIEGPLRGKTFEVSELASIGRGETCAVRLEGRHVSSSTPLDEGGFVQVLGSRRNVTFGRR